MIILQFFFISIISNITWLKIVNRKREKKISIIDLFIVNLFLLVVRFYWFRSIERIHLLMHTMWSLHSIILCVCVCVWMKCSCLETGQKKINKTGAQKKLHRIWKSHFIWNVIIILIVCVCLFVCMNSRYHSHYFKKLDH